MSITMWRAVQARLSPDFEAKLKAQGRWHEKATIETDTLRLCNLLCAFEAPEVDDALIGLQTPEALWGDSLAELMRKLEQGKIDANAIVKTESGPQGQVFASGWEPMFESLLHHGSWWAVPLYPAILAQVANPNGTGSEEDPSKPHEILTSSLVKHSPFLEPYLRDPRVDVNRLLDKGRPLLSQCIDMCVSGRPTAMARRYVDVLFECGAILPGQWSSVAPFKNYQAEEEGLEMLKPYVQSWEREWNAFQSGILRPEALTSTHLGHFYSVGHLEEAMSPARWRGYEAQALALFDELPLWVQEQFPCQGERHLLTIGLQPKPSIGGWGIANHGPLKPVQKAVDMD